ncbi:thioredoxin domain-containing protein [Evansella sp. AB-rgal1]|uniref:thioredoxin domain-containing protein n=1 Tax=Evansella sp. AB-rgal1 TaxID=3242696 RepID=UPI00359ED71F
MKGKLIVSLRIFCITALIVMSGLFLLTSYDSLGKESNKTVLNESENESERSNIFDTSEFIEGRVFLGNEDAPNEVILVLDYMCPFCKEWIEDIFIPLKEEFIDNGEAKFYSFPQVYLSKKTLALTEFTQKVEEVYPELYFDLLERIFTDHELEHWGTDEYIRDLDEAFGLEGWEEVELDYDVIRRTRQVTRGLEVEVVPTVYVNGRKVNDRMDYEEISNLIKSTRNMNSAASGEVCERDAGDC